MEYLCPNKTNNVMMETITIMMVVQQTVKFNRIILALAHNFRSLNAAILTLLECSLNGLKKSVIQTE